MSKVIEGIPVWLEVYLSVNLVMAIISWCIIEYADKYWRKHEDANLSTLSSMLIYPSFIVGKYTALTYGYALGFISVFLSKEWLDKKLNNQGPVYKFLKDMTEALVIVLFWSPLFILTIYLEIKWRMEMDGDE